MTTPRFDLPARLADGYQAVLRLETIVRGALDPTLLNLVKLRASVVNGCAFCVDMHGTHLLGDGEDPRRVLAVATWHESPFFTDAERAALALTDAVTRLGEGGVPEDVWAAAEKHHGTDTAAHLVLAIATINVWNRLAITSGSQPPALEAA
ncbi:MAG TPA: carboxymuconolactone decarboxylase family protein [Acidimicrobiales bacterium]|nr:carboxymuconolactone decarboxylase family protein [Acidimicrobiales bacterium]